MHSSYKAATDSQKVRTQELNVLWAELTSLPSGRAVYKQRVRNSNILYPTLLPDMKADVQEELKASTSSTTAK